MARPMRPATTSATIALLAAAVSAFGWSARALSADHFDSPSVVAAPAADIADVFAWMDGGKVVLAMTVSPDATAATKFDDKVRYVFHVGSGAKLGETKSNVDVIATFDSSAPQTITLWAGAGEYLTGDASAPAGLKSADGKVTVFAGLRADPFFFNLDGYKSTVADFESIAAGVGYDDAGCPALADAQAGALLGQLQAASSGGPPADWFAKRNVLAIVVAIDAALVTQGGPIVSVWAGTYAP